MMPTLPDLSSRPFKLEIEEQMEAPPAVVYRAWTEDFARWFAAPGTVLMKPEVDSPFFFETHFEGQRHPHYGRFLQLVPDEFVELTWLTGDPGTKGAETVLSIQLEASKDGGTHLRLSHAGFADEETKDGHKDAWPHGIAHLDACLKD